MRTMLVAATLAAALVASTASFAETVTLRISHAIPPTAIPAPEWEKWWASIEVASGGEIKIQVYPSAQLGAAGDQYDLVRDGVADMAWVVPGASPGRFPIFGALELPGMISNSAEAIRVFDAWYAPFALTEMSDVKYCIGHTSPLATLNMSRNQVRVPADMAGLKFRPQNATQGNFFSQLGASIVQVSAAEAKQALDTGVIDSLAFPWRTLFVYSLEGGLDYHMDLPLMSGPSVWVMNKARYESLPPKAKAAIDSHCTPEWAHRIISAWSEWEAPGRQQLLDIGNTIYQLDDEEKAAWIKAAEDFQAQWVVDQTTPQFDAASALASFKGRLAAAKAGF